MPTPRLNSLFKQQMTRKEFLGLSVFALASVFGIVGILEELKSHAATPFLSEEAESGTVTSPATTITDTTASGGKAVKFEASNTTGGSGVTVSGGRLQLNGVSTRFSGMNAFQLGTDTTDGGTGGNYIPANSQIAAAFTGLSDMGCTMIRSHTIGQSCGLPTQFMTGVSSTGGVYKDSNLSSADYALSQAKAKGIYIMTPLTDNYNYYAGGKWNFIHFAYQQNPSGITDVNGANGNETQFFATTTGGLRIRALFKDYISHWLNHVNSVTVIAYKDDPTLALIETGNEIDDATAEWTADIAAYIKSIAPKKLVVDGSGDSWARHGSTQSGYGAANVDVLSVHYYPNNNMSEFSTMLGTDISEATSKGQALVCGEYPWTAPGYAGWFSELENATNLSFDAAWTYVLNSAGGQPEGHGGGFGSADVGIHGPYSGSMETTYGPGLTSHITKITGRTRGSGY